MFKKIALSMLLVLTLAFGISGVVGAQAPGPDTEIERELPERSRRAPQKSAGRFADAARRVAPEILGEALGMEADAVIAAIKDGQTVAELAAEQGVALDDVLAAALVPVSERLAQAVTDGKLTQEEADVRLEEISARIMECFENGIPQNSGRRSGRGNSAERRRNAARRVAPEILGEALGMEADAVIAALKDGQTVAELAAEQGVALDDVLAAALVPVSERLAQAVTDGKLTQEEADVRLEEISARIMECFENGIPQNSGGRPGRGNSRTPRLQGDGVDLDTPVELGLPSFNG